MDTEWTGQYYSYMFQRNNNLFNLSADMSLLLIFRNVHLVL